MSEIKLLHEMGNFINDKGQTVAYDKFYCNVTINDINYKLPVKIEEKFLKSCLKDNIENAVLGVAETKNSKDLYINVIQINLLDIK